MTAFGDLHIWASKFISTDEHLLERIALVWPKCVTLLPTNPQEDQITLNLVDLISKDPIVRRFCHWVEFQFEPAGTDPNGRKYSKGIIDLAVFLDWERERYIAYECKRLNVSHGSKRSSLATVYVTEGMMRFITNQYAEELPIGCMLGYVIDSDINFAKKQITKAIMTHKPLGLIAGPTTIAPIQSIDRFFTTHNRTTTKQIELRHALLPFSIV